MCLQSAVRLVAMVPFAYKSAQNPSAMAFYPHIMRSCRSMRVATLIASVICTRSVTISRTSLCGTSFASRAAVLQYRLETFTRACVCVLEARRVHFSCWRCTVGRGKYTHTTCYLLHATRNMQNIPQNSVVCTITLNLDRDSSTQSVW